MRQARKKILQKKNITFQAKKRNILGQKISKTVSNKSVTFLKTVVSLLLLVISEKTG